MIIISPIKILSLVFFCLVLSACATRDTAEHVRSYSASETLAILIDDHWQDFLSRNPVFATSLGVRQYDQQLSRLSVEAMEEEANAARGFLSRLKKIKRSRLSEAEKLNADLLALTLENVIAKENFAGRLMILTNRSGWHMNFARLPGQAPFFTEADYRSYVARLNDFPRQTEEGIETLKASIAEGYTQPCAPMAGYEQSIASHIVNDINDSVFMRPFDTMPRGIGVSAQQSLREEAEQAIKNQVIPAYKKLLTFYQDRYFPNCREASGLYGLAGAEDYYQHRVKLFTTTDMTSDEIHQLGLEEVRRINEEMREIMKKVGFKGGRDAFNRFLREDPQFYPKTKEELLRYTAYISKKADGELPKLFSVIPRMPYTVKPIPDDIAEKTTTAYYERPAGDGTRAGVYRINLSKLNERPLFELEALSLHEAVPGHHFQIALAQELEGLPAFRRYGGATAFVEGWALYAERLGLEMDFYQDPYSDFGRLSYEMWRACRLVVDTGLHAKGWSRQQAINFMSRNTALSMHNITSEVDRYITWPGQALAYKIGELKIRELRTRAENVLGDRFDIRRFHDTLLSNGAVPLTVLEDIMMQWIDEELGKSS